MFVLMFIGAFVITGGSFVLCLTECKSRGNVASGFVIIIIGILLLFFASHRMDIGCPVTSLPVDREFVVESVTAEYGTEQYITLKGQRFAGFDVETFLYHPDEPLDVKEGDVIVRRVKKIRIKEDKDFIEVK